MVVPPADRRPGCSSDTAFLRYDHRSSPPRQTAARAAAQMLLSSGTTIGRPPPADRCPGRCSDAAFLRYDHRSYPPTDHCPGRCSDTASFRYDHRLYPRQTAARAAAQMLLPSGTTIGRTPGRPLPGLPLRCYSPQVRPSVVPPVDHCPGRCLDAAFRRYDHRSYPRRSAGGCNCVFIKFRFLPSDHQVKNGYFRWHAERARHELLFRFC